MSELPPPPPEPPPGAISIQIPSDQMDYLKSYWELKDHGEIFAWSARLLHDLSKLDEAGWRLTLTKCEIEEGTRKITYSPDHTQVNFLMKWLAPSKEGWCRMPTAETLDRVMKVTK